MAKLAIVALAIGLVGVVTADYETIVYSPYTTLEADYNDPTVILRRRRHDNADTSKITASSAISHEFPVEAHPLDAKAFPSRQRRSDESIVTSPGVLTSPGGVNKEVGTDLLGRRRRSASVVTSPGESDDDFGALFARRRRSTSVVTSPGESDDDFGALFARRRRGTSTLTSPGVLTSPEGVSKDIRTDLLGRRRRSASVVTSPGESDDDFGALFARRRRGSDEVFYSPVETELLSALRKRDARGKRYALTEDERAQITFCQLG